MFPVTLAVLNTSEQIRVNCFFFFMLISFILMTTSHFRILQAPKLKPYTA